jgi:hypothetical protein
LSFLKRNLISVLLSVFVLAVVGLSLISLPVAAAGLWGPTSSYPTLIFSQSCVSYGGYVYCVGGHTGSSYTGDVYYAPLHSSGVGMWKPTSNYPTTIDAQSCAASTDGYVYCVGGYTGSSFSDAVYFASLHSSGVGMWMPTSVYPAAVASLSCVVSEGYIYCVGGYTGSSFTDAVYYAPVSHSGVGAWKSTAVYPKSINALSCVVSGSYIYCVGGYSTSLTSAVYFAPYSDSGVGAWKSTTVYPTGIEFQSCVVLLTVIFCVGGNIDSSSGATTSAVYYAFTSSSGVGSWKSIPSYPTSIAQLSCVVSLVSGYCIGGDANIVTYSGTTSAVYFAPV